MVRKPALIEDYEKRLRVRGLTLIEIIIVITIIVALAVLLLWAWQNQALKGRDARRRADLAKIRTALEDYYNDHGCYPPASALACDPGTGLQPYITKIPCDPITGESYHYEFEGLDTCPNGYVLFTNLETIPKGGCGPGNLYNYGLPNPGTQFFCGAGTSVFGCKSFSCVPVSLGTDSCPIFYLSEDCFGNCVYEENQCTE